MASERLQDKVCIVTGSSSGIGRAIALAYAQEGGLLVCADLKPEAREDVQSERGANTDELIRNDGGQAIFVKTDVSKAVEFEALVQKAVETFGRLDVWVFSMAAPVLLVLMGVLTFTSLVNNAGLSVEAGTPGRMIHETDESAFDLTMAVNTKSV